MKQTLLFVSVLSLVLLQACQTEPGALSNEKEKEPFDWMYNQRAYPNNKINFEAYRQAVQQTKMAKSAVSRRSNAQWELAGPLNIGGRITDVALHPTNPDIIYVGASVGGIFRSEDGGESWEAIFENEGVLTIGNIAISESDPDILYVGTGEANGSATSGAFFGTGVYKSVDGGDSWAYIGLPNSQHIGRIAVHPQNPDVAYVAAAGILYGKNDEKGLYRTQDGGQNWEQVLFVSDSTSVIDVTMVHSHPDTLFAASWERIRRPWARSYAGLTSGIWRSTDGGDSWERLENGLPPAAPNIGRIGLAASRSQPGLIMASYTTDPITNRFMAVYRSEDFGDSWEKVDNDNEVQGVFASFGWFFGNIRIHPTDPEEVYLLGVPLMRSDNKGVDWSQIASGNHVDNHGLEIHPLHPDFIVSGNDGGVYISENGGSSWRHVENLPITQFYNVAVDNNAPEQLYGGTQDNGTIRTRSGSLGDWERILGGDGFHVIVDPTNSNVVFAEYQWGNLFRSLNGGSNMNFIFNGGPNDRTNWNTPVVLDPSNPLTIYYGANRLYRSTDRGSNWEAISDDLTDGQHPSGSTSFGTLSTIAVAPTNSDVIFVGSDDGNVHQTSDGGVTWTSISDGLPDRYVTQLAVDPYNEDIVYVTLSGYRDVDYQPHVLRSEMRGLFWEDISGNLPEVPVNDIIIDPQFTEVIYIANDLGVWQTLNGGLSWEILGPGLPTTVVNDLVFHEGSRTLLAATFGRSIQKMELDDLVAVKTIKPEPYALRVVPNPLRGPAHIQMELPVQQEGQLAVFNLSGQLIRTLGQQQFEAGQQSLPADFSGLVAGQYILRFTSDKQILTGKFQVVR